MVQPICSEKNFVNPVGGLNSLPFCFKSLCRKWDLCPFPASPWLSLERFQRDLLHFLPCLGSGFHQRESGPSVNESWRRSGILLLHRNVAAPSRIPGKFTSEPALCLPSSPPTSDCSEGPCGCAPHTPRGSCLIRASWAKSRVGAPSQCPQSPPCRMTARQASRRIWES